MIQNKIQEFENNLTSLNINERLTQFTTQEEYQALLELATQYLQEQKQLLGLSIINHLISKEQFIKEIFQFLSSRWFELLESSDQRVQDLSTKFIAFYSKEKEMKIMTNTLIDKLLLYIRWDYEYRKRISLERLCKDLFKAPITDQNNRLKIIEPLFQSKYYFTNDKEKFVQGLLNTLLICIENQLGISRVSDLIEIIMRCSQHSNKYIRISALKYVQALAAYNEAKWTLIIESTIWNGLIDEAIEVKIQALRVLLKVKPKNLEHFKVPLLLNCHTENIMDQAAQIALHYFPIPQQGPPILGLISNIRDTCLQLCVKYSFESTLSRYYQLRCSGVQTLQSLVLFMKDVENGLPYKDIVRVAQNATFYETDPQVRQAGFSLLFHLSRLHADKIIDLIPLIKENCLFHLSDVPQNCKENCAKILSIIHQKEDLKEQWKQKFNLLRDKERLFIDFIGMEKIPEEQQEEVNRNIESQGGKEKVISKHASHLMWGLAFCFRYIAQQKDQDTLKFLITEIAQGLKYIEIHQHQTYEAIVDGLYELKSIKRLPVKLLDETDILQMMKQSNENQLLERIGGLIGPNILQGRL